MLLPVRCELPHPVPQINRTGSCTTRSFQFVSGGPPAMANHGEKGINDIRSLSPQCPRIWLAQFHKSPYPNRGRIAACRSRLRKRFSKAAARCLSNFGTWVESGRCLRAAMRSAKRSDPTRNQWASSPCSTNSRASIAAFLSSSVCFRESSNCLVLPTLLPIRTSPPSPTAIPTII